MKKFFFIFIFILILGVYFFIRLSKDRSFDKKKLIKTPIPTKFIPSPTLKSEKKINKTIRSIFVPYWSYFDPGTYSNQRFDRYLYFGITANHSGVDKNDTGYLKIDEIVNQESNQKNWWLVLRLLNDGLNQKILQDEELQEKIIQETLIILKEKGFDGLVLDLEIFTLFNSDIKDKINNFVEKFYTQIKNNYKLFSLCLYGDLFYRKRPYDLEFLAKNTDEIFIMAYDFSKTIGEPGPNFPFDLGHKYNYSFKKMIDDYLNFVSSERLTVIFGMYGYQWNVDENKRPISQAKALNLKEIKKTFYKNTLETNGLFDCQLKNCLIKRDRFSKEIEIDYFFTSSTPDENGIYRLDYYVVWHEDEESVRIKTEYLKEKSINSISYWVYGYF